MQTKKCNQCGEEKPLSEFHQQKTIKSGIRGVCKVCVNENIKEYTIKNKKKINKKSLDWYHQNKNTLEFKEKVQNYLLKNKKRIATRNKKYNKEHALEKQQYRETHKEHKRDKYLQRVYGITLEEYNQMLELQNGVCAICGKEETKIFKNKIVLLSVDHDHQTGKVRSLLCYRCNGVLGLVNDSIELFNLSINYLNKHKR